MSSRYKFVRGISSQKDHWVYVVQDEVSLQLCLAKAMDIHAPNNLLRQFRMEEEILSSLSSPWIPRLLDLEQGEERLVLYEEYFDGKTLNAWLKTKPSRAEKRRIFTQVADLVEKVHEAGYLYLDLKADNILICENHACLIDFNAGIPIGTSQLILANRESLPPEYQKQPLDERADQIGLGNLHRLMFGKSAVSWTCLQENPERRYQNLEALKKALRPAISRRMAWSAAVFGMAFLVAFAAPLYSMGTADQQGDASGTAGLDPDSPDISAMQEDELYDFLCAHSDLSDSISSQSEAILERVIEIGSAPLARYLLSTDICGQEYLETRPKEYLILKDLAGQAISRDELSRILKALYEQEELPDELAVLCQYLCRQELYLDAGQVCIFNQLLAKLPENYACETIDPASALLILQYGLLLESQNLSVLIPEVILEAAARTSQGEDLKELYERKESKNGL